LSGVGKPIQSSEDDIGKDDVNDDDVKYRKGSDEVARDDEAKEPEIPRQKVRYLISDNWYIARYVKSFFSV
jgi:hypothetical protein